MQSLPKYSTATGEPIRSPFRKEVRMRLYTLRQITVLSGFCLLALFLTGTAFAHDAAPDWMRELRNGENTKCCGQNDCTPVESIEILETHEATMQIRINGNIVARIRRTDLVPISCDKRPHVCLVNSIQQDGKIIPCWRISPDGSLVIFPSPRCYRCVLAQKDCLLSS